MWRRLLNECVKVTPSIIESMKSFVEFSEGFDDAEMKAIEAHEHDMRHKMKLRQSIETLSEEKVMVRGRDDDRST